MNQQIVEGFSLSHAQVLDGATKFLDALATTAGPEWDIYGVNDASIDPDLGDFDNEGDDSVLSTWSWFNFADLAVQAGYFSLPLWAEITGQTVETIGAIAAVNEVQTITITGTPTGGTFTLSFGGDTTATIAFNAAASAVQTALLDLDTLDTGDILVTGGPGPGTPYVVTFQSAGDYGAQDVAPITAAHSFTGGTTPNIAVAETTKGKPVSAGAFGLDLWAEDSFNRPPKPMMVQVPARDDDGTPCDLIIGLYRVQFRPVTFDGPAYKDGLKVNYVARAVQSSNDELGVPFPDGKKRPARVLVKIPA